MSALDILDISTRVVSVVGIIGTLYYPLHLWDWLRDRIYCRKRKFFSTGRVINGVKRVRRNVADNHFRPVMIVGIAGGKYVGGAIVASFLASSKMGFDLPATSLDLVRDDYGNPIWEECDKCFDRVVDDLKDFKKKKILLVDDIATTGRTTHKVAKELSEREENITIRVAMIVAKPEAIKRFRSKSSKKYWDERFCCNILPKQDMKVNFPWKSEVSY